MSVGGGGVMVEMIWTLIPFLQVQLVGMMFKLFKLSSSFGCRVVGWGGGGVHSGGQ